MTEFKLFKNRDVKNGSIDVWMDILLFENEYGYLAL